MPRIYKTKEGSRKREPWDKDKLKKAMVAALEGKSIRGTGKTFDVLIMLLKRYVRKRQQTEEISCSPNYKQAHVFTDEEEKELCSYLQKANKLHHGLTANVVYDK